MAGFVPENVLEQIREATDIVDLISGYFPLKKAGRSFKARCPFHDDSNPSFVVSPEKQTYYCFGCAQGGDAFAFVMAHDSLSFPEAVEMLAKRAGVEIPRTERPEDKTTLEIYNANEWAAKTYTRILLDDKFGKNARDYLAGRGFDTKAQERFRLGFAPRSRKTLVGRARADGISVEHLIKAGVVRKGEDSSVYDYFSSRIMFPICDAKGRVVGFGGRTLDGSEPKYLNTAETKVFNKSRILYGLNLARGNVRREGNAYLTEGYTDVLMAHLKGVDTAVAVLGTAVGSAHASTLRRYTPKVTMVFDADEPGKKALKRSIEIFTQQDVDVYVVELPGGTDLCSYIEKNGAEAFEKMAAGAEDFVSYELRKTASLGDRIAAVDRLLKIVTGVPDPVKKDAYLVEINKASRISLESLRSKAASGKAPSKNAGGSTNALPMTGERYALQSVLSGKVPVSVIVEETEKLSDADIDDSSEGRVLARLLTSVQGEGKVPEPVRFLSGDIDPVEKSLVVRLSEPLGDMDYEQQFRDSMKKIRDRSLDERAETLRTRIREAHADGNDEKALDLMREYNDLRVASVSSKEEN